MPTKLRAQIEEKARILTVLGDESRIRILNVLQKEGEMSVSDIASNVDMQVACTSHHLQVLKKSGIVDSRRDGNTIHYSLGDDVFVKKVLALTLK